MSISGILGSLRITWTGPSEMQMTFDWGL